jgi:hypothetical protein
MTGHRTLPVAEGQSSAVLPGGSADVKNGSCTDGQPNSYISLSKIFLKT